MPTTLSVIIPFYNAMAPLRKCLEALLPQTDEHCEVICVDDGSTEDYSTLKAAFPQVMWIRQVNQGPAAARNNGIRHSEGDLLFFTDSDCVPDSNWIAEMKRAFQDPTTDGVKGVYRTEQKAIAPRFVQVEYEEKYLFLSRSTQIDFIDTYSAGYRRKVFAADFFDESFPNASVEDQEFSFRLASKGYRFRFWPSAIVGHTHAKSISDYCRKKYKNGFWKVKILKKFPKKIKGDSHTPLTQKIQMMLAPALLLSVSLTPMIFLFVFLAFLVSNVGLWRTALKRDPFLLPIIPLFSFLRAVSLDAGLLFGFVDGLVGNFPHPRTQKP